MGYDGLVDMDGFPEVRAMNTRIRSAFLAYRYSLPVSPVLRVKVCLVGKAMSSELLERVVNQGLSHARSDGVIRGLTCVEICPGQDKRNDVLFAEDALCLLLWMLNFAGSLSAFIAQMF